MCINIYQSYINQALRSSERNRNPKLAPWPPLWWVCISTLLASFTSLSFVWHALNNSKSPDGLNNSRWRLRQLAIMIINIVYCLLNNNNQDNNNHRRRLRLRQLAASNHWQGRGRATWTAWKEVAEEDSFCFLVTRCVNMKRTQGCQSSDKVSHPGRHTGIKNIIFPPRKAYRQL